MTDLSDLLEQAREAFDQGDFDGVRAACDLVLSEAGRNSSEADQAHDLLIHTQEAPLLRNVANAADLDSALALLGEAERKGLKYLLDGRSLSNVRTYWEGLRQAEADKALTRLLAEGDESESAGNAAAAARTFEAAGRLPNASSHLVEAAKQRLKKLGSAIENRRQFDEQMQLALRQREAGQFRQALATVQSAQKLQPAGVNAADALAVELNTLLNKETGIATAQADAARARSGGNLTEAAAQLKGALALANELGLRDQQLTLQNQLADLEQELRAQAAKAANDIRQGREALNRGEWETAVGHFKMASSVTAARPDLTELAQEITALEKEALSHLEGTQDGARYKALGKEKNDPRDRLSFLRQARDLSPADPELPGLIAKAEAEIAEEAGAATLIEIDLGFDTPDEVEQGKVAANGLVIVDGIAQLQAQIGPEKLGNLAISYRQMFKRLAAAKLHDYVALGAGPLIRQGDYEGAIAVYDRALQMWKAEWVLKPDTQYKRIDPQLPPKTIMVGEKLRARLDIVAAQRSLAGEARDVYPSIHASLLKGDAAIQSSDYDGAIAAFEESLKAIQQQTAPVQYMLRGPRDMGVQKLADGLLRFAQTLSARARQSLVEAEAARSQGNLAGALEAARTARDLAPRIEHLRERYFEVMPESRQAVWRAESYQADAPNLFALIESHRADEHARLAGLRAMDDGDYEEAQRQFQLVQQWRRDEAQAELGRLPDLLKLKRGMEVALRTGDFDAAAAALESIIARSARNDWARRQRDLLEPQRQLRHDADRLLELARAMLDQRNFEAARKYGQQAQEKIREYPPALELLQNIQLRQQAYDKAETARRLMIEDFRRGSSEDDYHAALRNANEVLAENPEDVQARTYSNRAHRVLDLIAKVNTHIESDDWASARDRIDEALKVPQCRSSPYLNQRAGEISQELTARRDYDALIADSEAALKRAGTILKGVGAERNILDAIEALKDAYGKAKGALRQRFYDAQATALSGQARRQLMEIAQTRLRTDRAMTAPALTEATAAVRALQQVEGDETLQADILPLLKRAQVLVAASQHLDRNDPEAALSVLKDYAELQENLADHEIQQRYTHARLAAFLRQGKQAFERGEFDRAVQAFQSAFDLDRTHMASRTSLELARLEQGLSECNKALENGALPEAARVYLNDLPPDNPKVRDKLGELKALDDKLKEARQKQSVPDLKAAITVVDETLKPWSGYRPALDLRTAILQEAKQRAEGALERKEYGQARAWYELLRDKGMNEMRDAGREGYNRVSTAIIERFESVISRATTAQNNADLTEIERNNLEHELLELTQIDPDERRSTVSQLIRDMQERRRVLEAIEQKLTEAEAGLQNALAASTTDAIVERLTQVEKALEVAAGKSGYANRQRTRNLREQVKDHQDKIRQLQTATQNYETARQAFNQAPADRPPTFDPESGTQKDLEKHIDKLRETGEQLLDTTLNLIARILELDPDNQYRLREGATDARHDQLVSDRELWQARRQELAEIGDQVSRALPEGFEAYKLFEEAQAMYDEASKTGLFADAAQRWDESARCAQLASKELAGLTKPARSLPYTIQLFDLGKQIQNTADKLLNSAKTNANQARARQGELDDILDNARFNWNNYPSDIESARAALQNYSQIREPGRFPDNQEAKDRLRILDQHIRTQEKKRQRYQRVLTITIVLIVLTVLLITGGVLAAQPGGAFNPYTATPSPSTTSTRTPMPTDTHTPTSLPPTATLTVAAAATFTPLPTATPQFCTVLARGWIRESPSNNSVGLAPVQAETQLQVLDAVFENGRVTWYRVRFDNTITKFVGYIDASLVPISCP